MPPRRRRLRLKDPLRYERDLWDVGIEWVAGVDEVGRGPLAGPVVAAAVAVILPAGVRVGGASDSKLLSPKARYGGRCGGPLGGGGGGSGRGIGCCDRCARNHRRHAGGAPSRARRASAPCRPRGARRATCAWPRLGAQRARQSGLPDPLRSVRECGGEGVPRPSDGSAPPPLSRVRLGPQQGVRHEGP